MAFNNTRHPQIRDSLANMPLGMTFAQKARAAELNASIRRKMPREAEDEVPELAPMSLGALKFTKRTRGKAKNLNDASDEDDSTPSDVHLPPFPSSYATSSSTSQDDQHVKGQHLQPADTRSGLTSIDTAKPRHLHHSPSRSDNSNNVAPQSFTVSQPYHDHFTQWNPNMARQASNSQYGYVSSSSTPASSLHTSRHSSAMGHLPGPQNTNVGNFGVSRQHRDGHSLSNPHLARYGYERQSSSPATQGKENRYASASNATDRMMKGQL